MSKKTRIHPWLLTIEETSSPFVRVAEAEESEVPEVTMEAIVAALFEGAKAREGFDRCGGFRISEPSIFFR